MKEQSICLCNKVFFCSFLYGRMQKHSSKKCSQWNDNQNFWLHSYILGIYLCAWPSEFLVAWLSGLGGVFVNEFEELSPSNAARTSTIGGLNLGSVLRHCSASAAVACAPFLEYWPPNLVSIILKTLLLSLKNGFAQSTKVSSENPGLSSSTARLPVSNSNKTTPKLYTSLLGVRWPVQFKTNKDISEGSRFLLSFWPLVFLTHSPRT